MDKLIELLDEYEYFRELKEVPEEEKDLFVQKFFWHQSYGVLNSYGCEDYEILKRKFCYMYAISKEYGFIKWLVDNDKIGLDNKRNKKFKRIDLDLAEGMDGYEITTEDVLLMWLSIQEDPIEFLISILK